MQITSASEHIRKICAICVREKETDLSDLSDFYSENMSRQHFRYIRYIRFPYHERKRDNLFICVFRVNVYINHRYSGSHRCKSRAQASISVKSVLSVFEKKNKKQIYPIYQISIPKICRASISDTSASLITSASEYIR